MTDGEKFFISCLKRGDTRSFSSVNRDWLDGDEIRQYTFIVKYYRDHSELVGLEDFCDKFKLDSTGVKSRPTYYLGVLRERYIFASLTDGVPKLLKGLKDSPKDKLEELQKLVAKLSSESTDTKDSLYSEDTDERKAAYKKRAECDGVTHLSMGTPTLDTIFYGYGETDLITIGGKSGQGKTWLILYMAKLLEQVLFDREALGETFGDILFVSNEMNEIELKERMDCLQFRLPYGNFLAGKLSPREEKRYYSGLDELKKKRSKLRILYNCSTIDELTTDIGLYNPSAVFIDGSYLMEGKMAEGWEKITYITRNLKRMSKSFRVPIINTTQLKRGDGKTASKMASDGMESFAYGNSFVQDSDIAIRMYQDADMLYHSLVGMEIAKGRRVRGGTRLIFENNLDVMTQSITLPASDDTEPVYTDDI